MDNFKDWWKRQDFKDEDSKLLVVEACLEAAKIYLPTINKQNKELGALRSQLTSAREIITKLTADLNSLAPSQECAYSDAREHNDRCLHWAVCKFGGNSGMM